jgi:hypothetical protein
VAGWLVENPARAKTCHETRLSVLSTSPVSRASHPQWPINRGQRLSRTILLGKALMPFALRSIRSAKTGRSCALRTRWVNLTKRVCRSSFVAVCSSDRRAELRNLALLVLPSLQSRPVAGQLHSKTGRGSLRTDLLRLIAAVASNEFDLDRIKPLLKAALADDPDDALIWDRVYNAVTEPTPPPPPVASSIQQTPWRHNTSGFANSSEYRKDVDRVLRDELGAMYVRLPRFHETFFGRVTGLEAASEAVFKKCIEGSEPLFSNGWSGWPTDANQDDVLSWFTELNEKLATFAEEYKSTPTHRRRPLT